MAPPPGAGADAGANTPNERLLVQGEDSLTLGFGETRSFAVRYERAGVPVRGTRVRFALEGRAHDSTLSTLEATTDADGVARGEITAGQTVAAFQLRLLAGEAIAMIDVAVGDRGFGELRVEVDPYTGALEVAAVSVSVFAGLDCAASATLGGMGDRKRTLPDGSGEVRFLGLPAGITYAVVASGTNTNGELLARECTMVEIVADDERRTRIALRDLPMIADGVYELELALTSGLAAQTADAIEVAGGATLLAHGDARGAGLYLASLEAVLVANGTPQSLAAFRDAIANGEGEIFEQALVDANTGLHLTVATVAERSSTWLSQHRLRGRLSVSPAISPPFTLDEAFIAIAPEGTELRVSRRVDGMVEASLLLDASVLRIASMRVPISPREVAEETTSALLRSDEALGPSGFLRNPPGCLELTTWIASRFGCDLVCAASACNRAIGALAIAFASGFDSLGGEETGLELAGDAELLDENSDRRADELRATLAGAWESVGAVTSEGRGLRTVL